MNCKKYIYLFHEFPPENPHTMFYYANWGLNTLISRARGGEENICSQFLYLRNFHKIWKKVFLIFRYQKLLVTKIS